MPLAVARWRPSAAKAQGAFDDKSPLAPVIENDVLVGHGDACGQQLGDGAHHVPMGEVSLGIIVAADNEDAGMVSLNSFDEIVQVFEVVVVSRETGPALANRVCKVDGIILAGEPDISGHLDVVPATPQVLG